MVIVKHEIIRNTFTIIMIYYNNNLKHIDYKKHIKKSLTKLRIRKKFSVILTFRLIYSSLFCCFLTHTGKVIAIGRITNFFVILSRCFFSINECIVEVA